MSTGENILTAWDKTFETWNPDHLASFSTEDFELHDSDYSVDSKEETLTWSYNKGFRIAKFKTIYEDEKVSCLTYAVMKNGADHGKVICLDIYEAGKAKLWKILRASWINITSPWLLACNERKLFFARYHNIQRQRRDSLLGYGVRWDWCHLCCGSEESGGPESRGDVTLDWRQHGRVGGA